MNIVKIKDSLKEREFTCFYETAKPMIYLPDECKQRMTFLTTLSAPILCLMVSLFGPIASVQSVRAEEATFRLVAIDSKSTYPSCAVFDVDKDGKLDIVNGGQWFKGPGWQRKPLRDVQEIRGRFDDYSNLPLDVNGDGWVDIISANYRSQSLYWVENPANSGQQWKKHEIATPGAMETGRLADVDGDGKLDVLPNGVKFAAWWQLTSASPVTWKQHRLPAEVAGHGLGLGDINGDGNPDLVSTKGWFEGNKKGHWKWHAEFKLPRDGSIPILVWDIDKDGDADIAWGRGHGIGVYWLEQVVVEGRRTWLRHTIDTSISCAHSILLADMDGDGSKDLVVGKRYMGHDGKDPAEHDPLAVYWYRFDSNSRSFHRTTVSYGMRAGLGLDPKAIDVDGDGDIDIVGAGRSGLYLFENLRIDEDPKGKAKLVLPTPSNAKPTEPLTLAGQTAKIDSYPSWTRKRQQILKGMELAMGPQPKASLRVPLDVEWGAHEDRDNYRRYRITYQAEPGDRVPAYLLIPRELLDQWKPSSPFAPSTKQRPAMLCLHQTTRIGKGEPAGLGGRPTLHYAHELALRGYVCLVPDYPSFGDYPYDFRNKGKHYGSGSMKAIWNNVRAIDLLESLSIVTPDRIGCIGHSLGGHNSLFTAAMDQRLQAVITSCGFTAFHNYYGGKLAGWTSDRYMPRIKEQYGNDPDRVPFDFQGVLAAIAPRAIFINAPVRDSNFDITGVKRVVADIAPVFKLTKSKDAVTARYPESAHDFPDQQRKESYQWLDKVLAR